jgi:hypothetical protein
MNRKPRQAEAFHAPLHELDYEDRTFGCRHTNPDICAKHSMDRICAFVRDDNICQSPPVTWPKQFAKLANRPCASGERNRE